MPNSTKEDLQKNGVDNLVKKGRLGFIYAVVMLVGGIPVYKYLRPGNEGDSFFQLLVTAFLTQLACIGLGVVLKLLRRLFKKKGEKLFSKAFWVDAMEEGFSIWWLLVLLYAFRYLQWLKATGQLEIF